jgi:hypothetical protein
MIGVYFVLAMVLFPGIGYLRVRDKMTAALEGPGLARPSEKALRDLRRRVGPAPVRLLSETIAGPLAPPWVPGVSYRGLRTVAFDGLNPVKVPDSDRNRCWPGKTMTRMGLAGYPAMRIVALAGTGTRGLLGAVIGGRGQRSEIEVAYLALRHTLPADTCSAPVTGPAPSRNYGRCWPSARRCAWR